MTASHEQIEQEFVTAFVARTVPNFTDKVPDDVVGEYIEYHIAKGNMCNDDFQFDGRGWCNHMTSLLKKHKSKVTVTLLDDALLFKVPEKYRSKMSSKGLNTVFFFAVNYEDNRSTINTFTRTCTTPVVCINEEITNSHYKTK